MTNGDKQQGWYRSRNGVFLGVCRGLAERVDFSVFWLRVLWVLLSIFTGIWPLLIAYIILGLLMKPEPVVPFASPEDREFYDSLANSRAMAITRLKSSFDNLDKRIRRIESIVTSKEFQWERKL